MMDAARLRGVYDELVKSELTEFMAGRPLSADLITSADTLCYFGGLDNAFTAAAGALSDNGFLIFTVEAAAAEEAPSGHRINPHGRYSHSREYLERTLKDAAFAVVAVESEVLRTENHLPVQGFVVTARKLAGGELGLER